MCPAESVWTPDVLTEWETLQRCAQGASLARIGKEEIVLLNGEAATSQGAVPALVQELRQVVAAPPPGCWVGIPRCAPESPKVASMVAQAQRLRPWLAPRQQYASACISSTTLAPWIAGAAYRQAMEALWRDKQVALVCPPGNPLCRLLPGVAHKVHWFGCAPQDAYAQIGQLETALCTQRCPVTLLSCGATATCLAARLCRAGLQALDIGRMGLVLWEAQHAALTGTRLVALRHPTLTTPLALQTWLAAHAFDVAWMSE